MLKISKITLIVLCSFATIACETTKPSFREEDTLVKTAKINSQLGIAYLGEKNIPRAKQKLLTALKQAPGIPEPWYSMGYFFEVTGNQQEANQYYLKAIQIAPDRGEAHNNYGTYLCRQGRYQEAISQFLLAVKDRNYLTPADAYENAGVCAMKMPAYRQQALYYFDKSLMEDPTRSAALFQSAKIYFEMKQYQLAKEKLTQYLAISPPTRQSEDLIARIDEMLQTETPHQRAAVKAYEL